MKTVSTKETEWHGSRCDVCHLWYRYLHAIADGRFLCRMCLELEGENRAALPVATTR
jgi:hypothetical protein